jgi:RsiW-degrading membrane proteinase PrsW (M82 family)
MFINAVILAQIGVAVLFIRYLIQQNHGSKEPPKIIGLAIGLGVIAIVASYFLETWFVNPHLLVLGPRQLSTAATLHNSLLVGLIEEGCKSLPLALLIYSRKYFNKITDGVVYFGISGMIFGLIENIKYSLTLGEAAGFGKIITGPYIHAGFAVLIGWTLARQKVLHRGWWLVVAGFIASLGLHGLYDFGLIYGSGWTVLLSLAITLAININIFVLLRDAQKEDGKLGLVAVGNNYYCRNCGVPNPDLFLYCLQCGKKT